MTNFRFIIEYDGTDFEGWQAQGEGHRTVQRCLADALAALADGPVSLMGSGRTDAGVHAEAQVANARLDTRLSAAELHRALNATLPVDVAIRAVDPVPDAFDARRDAVAKRYRYRIWNHPVRSPLRARQSWWLRSPLDLGSMEKAAAPLVGEHDFASFQAAGSSVQTSVRRLLAIELGGRPGGEVHLDFEGEGFLRYMVRNLVGTLVEVGRGRLAPEAVEAILEARDRSAAAATAPACGLTLLEVRYADSFASSASGTSCASCEGEAE
jgi:tRNA pseudouridine38-40 synthase